MGSASSTHYLDGCADLPDHGPERWQDTFAEKAGSNHSPATVTTAAFKAVQHTSLDTPVLHIPASEVTQYPG
jgi:hypothetical protein